MKNLVETILSLCSNKLNQSINFHCRCSIKFTTNILWTQFFKVNEQVLIFLVQSNKKKTEDTNHKTTDQEILFLPSKIDILLTF